MRVGNKKKTLLNPFTDDLSQRKHGEVPAVQGTMHDRVQAQKVNISYNFGRCGLQYITFTAYKSCVHLHQK